jgi:glycine cleavage system aminomethyltransferase T/glycine/D-amino acid oxidase-like deaminating enzyme
MTSNQPSNGRDGSLPTHAQVVIIGGGIIGCSVAYHLTKLGWRDVVLLERAQLTSGTTWHAAGLVSSGGFRTETTIEMAKYTVDLFSRLGEETGQDTGFKPIGHLELACSLDELDSIRRAADFGRGFGIDIEELSTSEIQAMWPLMYTGDVLGGIYTAQDGRTNPVDTTMALAKGAKMGGARIYEGAKVTGIKKKGDRVSGVITDQGEIEAEYVVNCGGMWARELGKMAGVNVPLHAAEHYYLITEPIEGMHPDLPIVEESSAYTYFREEMGGILLGVFEPVAGPWGMALPGGKGGIPADFTFGEIAPDWDRLMPYLEKAMERIPVVMDTGIHVLFCGPESFTPDLGPLMGEAPELKNYYVAAGLNSLGILLGGGVGQIMAQWIVDGLPSVDVSEINIDRMSPFQNNPKYLHDRTVEVLGWMFTTWPNYQATRARNVCKSAMHDRLAEAGACFFEYSGWEYPEWFAPEGVEPKVKYSWGRQNWFEYAAAEHRAARENVVLMDLTLMSKVLVQGRDAEKLLNRICANNVAVPVGRCVYTQWLNERATIEADLTVTRLAEDSYLVVLSPSILTHVVSWLNRHIPDDAHVFVTDVTSAYNIISIQGPQSRKLLSGLTSADVSNEAFSFRTMREIDMGYALVKALRLSYVGELGWELYVPTEFTLHVYDMLVEAGEALGMKHAGLGALDTLRLEKGYRDYGNDIDNQDTPLEAGLGFFVDFDKPGGFIGKETLLQQKERGILEFRLAQFLVEDPEPLLHGGETVIKDGKRVGYVRAGGYGHTLGGSVGLGQVENTEGVTADFIKSGGFEIEIASVRYPAKASLRPMYDPKNLRVRS